MSTSGCREKRKAHDSKVTMKSGQNEKSYLKVTAKEENYYYVWKYGGEVRGRQWLFLCK